MEQKLPHTDLFTYDSSITPFHTKFFVACQKFIQSKIRIYFLTTSMSLVSFTTV